MFMNKVKSYDVSGKHEGDVSLPSVFDTPFRPDLIKKAVLAEQANQRQPYGSDPLAGKKTSAHYHGSRHYRFSMMNKGISRMPRIHGKVGYMALRGRFAPHAVKGRPAHPPKVEKIWSQKINAKEKTFAIMSALAASSNMELVKKRGHKVSESPVIFNDGIEKIKKSKEAISAFSKMFSNEMERCSVKKVKAGISKMRGRRYTVKKGPLVIVSGKCDLMKSAKNIMGFDVVPVESLSAEKLAPGTHAGRAVIISQAALKKIEARYC